MLANPTLEGTVVAQFFIAASGKVLAATAAGLDPEMATCVTDVIKRLTFPKPSGGGGVAVAYPFIFRPAGDDDATPSTPPADRAGTAEADPGHGTGKATAIPDSHEAEAGSNTASGSSRARALFRAPDRAPADASRYDPGEGNPLRVEQQALTECLRESGQRFGAVVVELHYDATGHVSEATTHGLDDKDARSCVIATAKHLQRTGAGPSAQRCSVAFGVMPPAAVPAIDITADAIKLDGKPVAKLPAAATADAHGSKVPDLLAALVAKANAATVATGPALVMYEPRIVRPIPSTPMGVVVRVLASVLAADGDFVLAAQRGNEWQPLQSIPMIPVVPVPFGTGGKWNRIKGRHGLFVSPDDERVVLSLLVTEREIWVGLSRVNEFQQIERGPSQLDKLTGVLREHKASAFFADRVDVEIAAEDRVTYGDVVNVIDTAAKAGFIGWQLTDPSGLAARPNL